MGAGGESEHTYTHSYSYWHIAKGIWLYTWAEFIAIRPSKDETLLLSKWQYCRNLVIFWGMFLRQTHINLTLHESITQYTSVGHSNIYQKKTGMVSCSFVSLSCVMTPCFFLFHVMRHPYTPLLISTCTLCCMFDQTVSGKSP